MATLISKPMSLQTYLSLETDTDHAYELVNGELVEVPPESEPNRRIASFLFAYFLQQGIPSYRLTQKTEIVVSGAGATTRIPDLMILSEELATALEGATRSTIMPDMPPPLLVVEVVSPGQENRDYRYKRSEYAARGISEYWIVDPMLRRVTVLEWIEGLYEGKAYEGNSPIHSVLSGEMSLTPNQLWNA
ncbi:MAG: Uma2 family endonuclease [Thermostichus sp. BF3_bins_97]